jgi:hypothetical protein
MGASSHSGKTATMAVRAEAIEMAIPPNSADVFSPSTHPIA